MENKIRLEFLSLSENENFARNVIACFALKLNPSVAEIADVKTAVSEAVTNAIVHGYKGGLGVIVIEAEIEDRKLHINVFDKGAGIENVEKAVEPFFTTAENKDHSGMGFTIMKSFMDSVEVKSKLGYGTEIYMQKRIKAC